MNDVDYGLAAAYFRPGEQFSITDNDYSLLNWFEDTPKPTKTELEAAWPQVQYDREHARVEAARRTRYQQETDGMFFAAQRDGGDLAAWLAAVDAIKADLPYPSAP
jgi:hypothetical protein